MGKEGGPGGIVPHKGGPFIVNIVIFYPVSLIRLLRLLNNFGISVAALRQQAGFVNKLYRIVLQLFLSKRMKVQENIEKV